ncbi:MAG: restriction endonuclease subunit S [Bacteroidales bacterium]|nr:restriction endonuclease subunit S [Bacteroidales bacterium]
MSLSKYSQAESLLLETLGLENFEPSEEAVNIKNFSESFGTSGRLDAEYYQVKYEDITSSIKKSNYDILNNLVTITKSIEPGSVNYDDEGLPFIRVADYDKFGFSTPDKYLKDSFVKDNKDRLNKLKPKKETILFTKDGSVGNAYMLRKDENFVTSGAILHLIIKDKTRLLPEYLTLVLNSQLVQMQAERDAGGSIILHWRVSEIENVVIPIIDFSIQQQIASLIEEGFSLKSESERLLEVAKTAVEMAIEEGEEKAMEFIDKNIGN